MANPISVLFREVTIDCDKFKDKQSFQIKYNFIWISTTNLVLIAINKTFEVKHRIKADHKFKRWKMSEEQVKSIWSELWLKEDYWAIWLGFFLLILGTLFFLTNPPEGLEEKIHRSNSVMKAEANRAPFKTIAYYNAQDAKKSSKPETGRLAVRYPPFSRSRRGGHTIR